MQNLSDAKSEHLRYLAAFQVTTRVKCKWWKVMMDGSIISESIVDREFSQVKCLPVKFTWFYFRHYDHSMKQIHMYMYTPFSHQRNYFTCGSTNRGNKCSVVHLQHPSVTFSSFVLLTFFLYCSGHIYTCSCMVLQMSTVSLQGYVYVYSQGGCLHPPAAYISTSR